MKIGVIQASSQASKNITIYETVKKYALESDVINFGCYEDEETKISYVEISILIGMLLNSKAVDFIVTGCSSGQGMSLACNSMPGVLCGYAPTPKDAYLFAQINNGNAISLPLGEEYTWSGYDNLDATIKELFSEPFGKGYPKDEAARKLEDTELLKRLREKSQIDFDTFFKSLNESLLNKIYQKNDVMKYIKDYDKE